MKGELWETIHISGVIINNNSTWITSDTRIDINPTEL